MWKMHFIQCCLVRGKIVSSFQFFRKKIFGYGITFQCLTDSFDDGIIGQSCGKSVYRLHGMKFFIVSGSRIIDLWMFHDQSVTFTNHSAT